MNQELQLGKYEFYPNEDELKRMALIDSFFEKTGTKLSNKDIEELFRQIKNDRN